MSHQHVRCRPAAPEGSYGALVSIDRAETAKASAEFAREGFGRDECGQADVRRADFRQAQLRRPRSPSTCLIAGARQRHSLDLVDSPIQRRLR